MISDALESSIRTMRPFVPAKDLGESSRFYESLGFSVTSLGPTISQVQLDRGSGSFGFLLQDFYVAEFASNFMMQLLVDDLDSWWSHIESLSLDKRFHVPPPKPPRLEPWGLRISYVVDPSGVLWHIAAEAR